MSARLWIAAALLIAGSLGSLNLAAAAPAGAPPAATLPAATCSLSGSTRTCALWARTGSITLPGPVVVPIWGYSDTAGGPE